MQINQSSKPFYETQIACPVFSQNVNTAHNLGTVNITPKAVLVCKIAEYGYTVGQTAIPLSLSPNYYGNSPFSVVDANNVMFSTAVNTPSGLTIIRKDTFNGGIPTVANWDLKIRIEAN